MSKIEQLIAELCPDGVEYFKMWELTTWDKRFNEVENHKQPTINRHRYLLAKDLRKMVSDNGDIRLLATGNIEDGMTDEGLAGAYLKQGEIVAIPWGGTARVKYHKGKYVTADNRIACVNNPSQLVCKYLYYWMLNRIQELESFYRGSGIKHPSMNKVLHMAVPVPPLPVQEEIVRILDTFTQLEAELEAELEARRSQYEYYRERLFDLDDSNFSFRWMTLGDVGPIRMCKRIFKHETHENGEVPFFKIGTFGGKPNAFISQDLFDEYRHQYSFPKEGNVLISAAGTIGKAVLYDGVPAYFQDSNIVWIENDERLALDKYLYHFYATSPWIAAHGGTITRLYNDNIRKTRIPVPPLEEQERIVAILDKFEALTNDISIGLPAELAMRRQQYEYYRDKLLTFQERKATA